MTTFLTSYQPLEGVVEEGGNDNMDEQSPDEQGNPLVHIVPESGKKHWNHIEDLDSFFTRVYQYHQQNGFLCMMLQQVFELVQFLFVVVFSVFLVCFVDYDILFRNKMPPGHNRTDHVDKISLFDALYPYDTGMQHISWKIVIFLLMATAFWLLRLGIVAVNYFYFWEIKKFYNCALGVQDKDLTNVTWDEVQQRVMEVQITERMCIHKEALTELDIYHRILRFTNYFVAMVNKKVIGLQFVVPFFGEVTYLTRGLRYNIELLLFWGPWAPFENNWHLRDEYKRYENRRRLSEELSRRIFYDALANFVFFPFILIWQILYTFFSYAEQIKREPGTLGTRRWSHYGEVYLRHFNELDHELNARLNRGYRAASQYMNIFTSPFLAVVARHLVFICGSFFVVLTGLTIYDEDVIQVEHILLLMTLLATALACCRVFIPEENLVWCPELLLTRVLAEVHYLPESWRGKGHTSQVRHEFSQIFQYRVVHILEEMLSPIISPLVLYFLLRKKSLEIVDFYRNFSVEVVGVGDVCSFAQMDIRKHGSATWQPTDLHIPPADESPVTRASGGKTELSLVHFALTNPNWKPPRESDAFLVALRSRVHRDLALPALPEENALFSSLNSLSYGAGIEPVAASMYQPPWHLGGGALSEGTGTVQSSYRGAINHMEGPRIGSVRGIFTSLSAMQEQSNMSTLGSSPFVDPVLASRSEAVHSLQMPCLPHPQDLMSVDMNLSALYLHKIYEVNKTRAQYADTSVATLHREGSSLYHSSRLSADPTAQSFSQVTEASSSPTAERTPLLNR